MNFLPSDPSRIKDFPFDKSLLYETAAQVNRDLELSGTGIHVKSKPANLEILLEEVRLALQKIDSERKMPGFLYRVDISSAEKSGENIPIEILVVFRCLMKVLMRKKYSGK